MGKDQKTGGMEYSPHVVGKHYFRVRERHVAEHLAPLLTAGAVGAVKLDLVLRGIAFLPQHAGRREVGLVRPTISYEDLHDLCRPSSTYMTSIPEDEYSDPKTLEKKRKWTGEQLQRLEELGILVRRPRPGWRPSILVLRDDGTRDPFDDPDGKAGNSYVTISGSIIASGWLKLWKAPEVSAYLAAMVADRFARFKGASVPVGGATWYQPLRWFSNRDGDRPEGHIAIPFSTRTLERGFQALRNQGLVAIERTTRRPGGGRRFSHPRSVYTNQFHQLDAVVKSRDEKILSEVD